jgi:hypothetical protein
MDFKKHYKAWIATTIVVASILSRILIQIPNVSAITTVAMMSGILLGGYWMWVVPFGSLVLSDLIMAVTNNYGLGVADYLALTPFVYGAFALVILVGFIISKQQMWRFEKKLLVGSLATPVLGSGIFFLVTNFFVWLNPIPVFPDMYIKTWEGLMNCYAAAIPFYRNAFSGDLLVSFGVFGVYYLVTRKVSRVLGANAHG